MRGSIRRRGSTYTWYISVPDPMTGERRQRSKGGFRTQRESGGPQRGGYTLA